MTGRMTQLMLAAVLGLAAAHAVGAQPQTATEAPPANNLSVSLLAESATPAAGGTTMLAVVMDPRPGWHGYWRTPGDTGLPTRFEWTLPAAVTAGQPLYPVPETLVIGGLMNHVYEKSYALLVPLQLSGNLTRGGRLPIGLKLSYLVCTRELCVPETATTHTELSVGDGAADASAAARFAAWRAALPRTLDQPARFSVQSGRFRLALPLPRHTRLQDPHLFADTPDAVIFAAPQTFSQQDGELVVETATGPGAPARFHGVVRLAADNGIELSALPGAVGAGRAPVASAGGTVLLTVMAFAGAMLGGLILNVMPCVFPILSLKALSLARSGMQPGSARGEALAYTAGVVLVCAALGALVLALRAAGVQVGWAFQLQKPAVILCLILLTAAIGFNLAGLFELGAVGVGSELASQAGPSGAFWTGALAAFVATPCTGPFMAAALGAALVLPAIAGLLVFIGLGLGLALPFLAIGFFPPLRRCLPGPGAWMSTFRHVLSVPMFLTVLGLAWVIGHQAGADGVVVAMGALLLLAMGLWITGRRQRASQARVWLPSGIALVLSLACLALLPGPAAHAIPTAAAAGGVERFDTSRLAALRAAGRPVFLYLTAEWCLSCKVNEKVAIERSETQQAFARAGVVTMVGDWTDGNREIGAFLEAHGRPGVPMYLWYAPGREPQVLPQILSVRLLVNLTETVGSAGVQHP